MVTTAAKGFAQPSAALPWALLLLREKKKKRKSRIKCKRVFLPPPPPPSLPPIHQGTATNPGINQRALQLLFSEVRGKAADWDYAISVSAAEIYNEALRYREETGGGRHSSGASGAAGGAGVGGHHPNAALRHRPTSLVLAAHLAPKGFGRWIWLGKDLFLNLFPVHAALPKHSPSSSVINTGSQPCHRSHSPGLGAASPSPPWMLYLEITNWALGA